MEGLSPNLKFSNKFETMKEKNFKINLVHVGSCSFHKLCNVFREGQYSLNCRFLFFKALFQLYDKMPVRTEVYTLAYLYTVRLMQ